MKLNKFFSLAAALLCASSLSAATLQSLISEGTADGAIIIVPAGTYDPSDLTDETRTLIFKAEEKGAVILEGAGAARCADLSDTITLDGFVIRNGKAECGGGVRGGTVINSTIQNCTADFGGGAYKTDLRATVLKNNSAEFFGTAAYGGTMMSCRVEGNASATYGGGMGALFGVTVANTSVTGNTATRDFAGALASRAQNMIFCNNTATKGLYDSASMKDKDLYGGSTPEDYKAVSNDATLFSDAENGKYDLNFTEETQKKLKDLGDPTLGGYYDDLWYKTDLAGRPRLLGTQIDIGPYEIAETFTVTCTVEGVGAVALSATSVQEGDDVTFTATEDTDYVRDFDGFYVNGELITTEMTMTYAPVKSDVIVARFKGLTADTSTITKILTQLHPETREVVTLKDGNYTISGLTKPVVFMGTSIENTVITATADQKASVFVNVTVSGTPANATIHRSLLKTVTTGTNLTITSSVIASDCASVSGTAVNVTAYGEKLTSLTCTDCLTISGDDTVAGAILEKGNENIDAGANNSGITPYDNYDIGGRPRVMGEAIDKGAHECHYISLTVQAEGYYTALTPAAGTTDELAGDKLTLTVESPREFKGWTLEDGTVVTSPYTLPEEDVTLIATFAGFEMNPESTLPEGTTAQDTITLAAGTYDQTFNTPAKIVGTGVQGDVILIGTVTGGAKVEAVTLTGTLGTVTLNRCRVEEATMTTGSVTATNSIFIDSTVSGSFTNNTLVNTTPTVTGEDVNNLIAAEGLFAEDYQLAATATSAIDQGPTTSTVGAIDYYGNPRVNNGKIDLGAAEYQWPPYVVTINVIGHGLVSHRGEVEVVRGSTLTFTAKEDPDHPRGTPTVTVGNEPLTGEDDVYTVTPGEQDSVTVTVIFAPITVGPSGKEFADLAEAVAEAQDGDTITVDPGTYGAIDVKGKAIKIVASSNNPAETIIDARGLTRAVNLADGAEIIGFTIQNGVAAEGAGVNGGTVRRCIIKDNKLTYNGTGAGICNAKLAESCLIYGNGSADVARSSGGGAANSTLLNCTVAGNTATTGAGLYECTATNSVVALNADPSGVSSDWYGDSVPVESSACCTPDTTGAFALEADKIFVAPERDDWRLREGIACIDAVTDLTGLSTHDAAGNLRQYGGAVDMGALEWNAPDYQITVDFRGSGQVGVSYEDATAGTVTETVTTKTTLAVPRTVKSMTFTWSSVGKVERSFKGIYLDGTELTTTATYTWTIAVPNTVDAALVFTANDLEAATSNMTVVLADAASGETVRLADGTYTDKLTIKENVTVIGESIDGVILQGGATLATGAALTKISATAQISGPADRSAELSYAKVYDVGTGAAVKNLVVKTALIRDNVVGVENSIVYLSTLVNNSSCGASASTVYGSVLWKNGSNMDFASELTDCYEGDSPAFTLPYPDGDDYSLLGRSPLIDFAGTPAWEGFVAEDFAKDLAGNTRPSLFAYDAGAYEYRAPEGTTKTPYWMWYGSSYSSDGNLSDAAWTQMKYGAPQVYPEGSEIYLTDRTGFLSATIGVDKTSHAAKTYFDISRELNLVDAGGLLITDAAVNESTGTLNLAAPLQIGAQFVSSSGAITILDGADILISGLWQNTGSVPVTISGGAISTEKSYFGENSIFRQTGGEYNFGSMLELRNTATAVFAGGTVTGGEISVAVPQSDRAALRFTGADVTVERLETGDTSPARYGNIEQTGGTVTLTGSAKEKNAPLHISHWSGNSTYSLKGGTLVVPNSEVRLGRDGTGYLKIFGGVAKLHSVVSSSGNVQMRGGTYHALETQTLAAQHWVTSTYEAASDKVLTLVLNTLGGSGTTVRLATGKFKMETVPTNVNLTLGSGVALEGDVALGANGSNEPYILTLPGDGAATITGDYTAGTIAIDPATAPAVDEPTAVLTVSGTIDGTPTLVESQQAYYTLEVTDETIYVTLKQELPEAETSETTPTLTVDGDTTWSDSTKWSSEFSAGGDAVVKVVSGGTLNIDPASQVSIDTVTFDIPEGETLTITATTMPHANTIVKPGLGTLRLETLFNYTNFTEGEGILEMAAAGQTFADAAIGKMTLIADANVNIQGATALNLTIADGKTVTLKNPVACTGTIIGKGSATIAVETTAMTFTGTVDVAGALTCSGATLTLSGDVAVDTVTGTYSFGTLRSLYLGSGEVTCSATLADCFEKSGAGTVSFDNPTYQGSACFSGPVVFTADQSISETLHFREGTVVTLPYTATLTARSEIRVEPTVSFVLTGTPAAGTYVLLQSETSVGLQTDDPGTLSVAWAEPPRALMLPEISLQDSALICTVSQTTAKVWSGTNGTDWSVEGNWNGNTFADGDSVAFKEDAVETTVTLTKSVAPEIIAIASGTFTIDGGENGYGFNGNVAVMQSAGTAMTWNAFMKEGSYTISEGATATIAVDDGWAYGGHFIGEGTLIINENLTLSSPSAGFTGICRVNSGATLTVLNEYAAYDAKLEVAGAVVFNTAATVGSLEITDGNSIISLATDAPLTIRGAVVPCTDEGTGTVQPIQVQVTDLPQTAGDWELIRFEGGCTEQTAQFALVNSDSAEEVISFLSVDYNKLYLSVRPRTDISWGLNTSGTYSWVVAGTRIEETNTANRNLILNDVANLTECEIPMPENPTSITVNATSTHFTLAGDDQITAPIVIAEGSVFTLAASAKPTTITNHGTLILDGGAVLDLSDATIFGTGTYVINAGATYKLDLVDDRATTSSFEGEGTIEKSGRGTFNLAYADLTKFTGTLKVTGGRLLLKQGSEAGITNAEVAGDGQIAIRLETIAPYTVQGSGFDDVEVTFLAPDGRDVAEECVANNTFTPISTSYDDVTYVNFFRGTTSNDISVPGNWYTTNGAYWTVIDGNNTPYKSGAGIWSASVIDGRYIVYEADESTGRKTVTASAAVDGYGMILGIYNGVAFTIPSGKLVKVQGISGTPTQLHVDETSTATFPNASHGYKDAPFHVYVKRQNGFTIVGNRTGNAQTSYYFGERGSFVCTGAISQGEHIIAGVTIDVGTVGADAVLKQQRRCLISFASMSPEINVAEGAIAATDGTTTMTYRGTADAVTEIGDYTILTESTGVYICYMAYAKTCIWTGEGPDTNWSTGANWTTGVAPSAADDVVIPAGSTVTLDTDAAVNTLTVSATDAATAAVFSGEGSLTAATTNVNGDLDVSAVTASLGAVTVAEGKALTVTYNKANQQYASLSAASGSLRVANDVTVAAVSEINAAGTWIVAAGTTTTLPSGTNNVSISTIKVESGATLDINGCYDITPAAVILADGAVLHNTTEIPGPAGKKMYPNLTLTGGTATVSGLSFSSIAGSHANHTLYLNGGTLDFVMESGNTFYFTSLDIRKTTTSEATEEAGTLQVTSGTLYFGNTAKTDGNTNLVIKSGAQVTLDTNYCFGSLAGEGTFTINSKSTQIGALNTDTVFTGTTSAGTLTKVGTGVLDLSKATINSTTFAITGGTLILPAGKEGSIEIPAETTVKLVLSEEQLVWGYASTANGNVTFVKQGKTDYEPVTAGVKGNVYKPAYCTEGLYTTVDATSGDRWNGLVWTSDVAGAVKVDDINWAIVEKVYLTLADNASEVDVNVDLRELTTMQVTGTGSLRLALDGGTAAGSGTIAVGAGVTLVSAEIYAADANLSVTGVNDGGGAFALANQTNTTISGSITTAAAVTFKSESDMTLTSTSNTFNGPLEVVSGTLTLATASQGLKNTVTIASDAKMIGTSGDALSYSTADAALIVNGTLALADGIRWTVSDADTQVPVTLGANAKVTGTGGESSGQTMVFDFFHATSPMTVTGAGAVIEGPIGAHDNGKSLAVTFAEGASLELKGGTTSTNFGITTTGAGSLIVSSAVQTTGTLAIGENTTLMGTGSVSGPVTFAETAKLGIADTTTPLQLLGDVTASNVTVVLPEGELPETIPLIRSTTDGKLTTGMVAAKPGYRCEVITETNGETTTYTLSYVKLSYTETGLYATVDAPEDVWTNLAWTDVNGDAIIDTASIDWTRVQRVGLTVADDVDCTLYVTKTLPALTTLTVDGSGALSLIAMGGGGIGSGTLAIAENVTVALGVYDAAANLTVTGVTVDETTTSGVVSFVADHTGTITLNDAITLQSVSEITLSGVISGTGLIEVAQGTLTLTANNNADGAGFTGNVIVNNGATLTTTNGFAYHTSNPITVNGIWNVGGGNYYRHVTGGGTITVTADTVLGSGTGSTKNGIQDFTGLLTVAEGATLNLACYGTAYNLTDCNLTVNGTLKDGQGKVTITIADDKTLSGKGEIQRPVTFAAGSTLTVTDTTKPIMVKGEVTATDGTFAVVLPEGDLPETIPLVTSTTELTVDLLAVNTAYAREVTSSTVEGVTIYTLSYVKKNFYEEGLYAEMTSSDTNWKRLTWTDASGTIYTADEIDWASVQKIGLTVAGDCIAFIDLSLSGLTSLEVNGEGNLSLVLWAWEGLDCDVGTAAGNGTLAIAEGVKVMIQDGYASTANLTVTGAGTVSFIGNHSGTIALNDTITLRAETAGITLSGAISGTGSIEVVSGYDLTLTAANTYTGDTTIASGAKLIVNTGSAVTWSESTTAKIVVNGELEYQSTGLVYRGLTGAGTVTIAGNVGIPNTGDSGNNAWDCGLSAFTGSVVVNENCALDLYNWGQPYDITLTNLTVNAGATVKKSHGGGAATITVDNLAGTGTIESSVNVTFASGATLTVADVDNPIAINGTISAPEGGIVVVLPEEVSATTIPLIKSTTELTTDVVAANEAYITKVFSETENETTTYTVNYVQKSTLYADGLYATVDTQTFWSYLSWSDVNGTVYATEEIDWAAVKKVYLTVDGTNCAAMIDISLAGLEILSVDGDGDVTLLVLGGTAAGNGTLAIAEGVKVMIQGGYASTANLTVTGAGTVSFIDNHSGTIALNDTVTLRAETSDITLSGVISGTGSIEVVSGYDLTLTADNNSNGAGFTGNVTVNSGATLTTTNGFAFHKTNPITVNGTWNVGGGEYYRYVGGTGTVNITANATLGAGSESGSVTGILGLTGLLTIAEGATLNLACWGAEYDLTGCNLTVNGILKDGQNKVTITIADGKTLSGKGEIQRPVTFAAGSTLTVADTTTPITVKDAVTATDGTFAVVLPEGDLPETIPLMKSTTELTADLLAVNTVYAREVTSSTVEGVTTYTLSYVKKGFYEEGLYATVTESDYWWNALTWKDAAETVYAAEEIDWASVQKVYLTVNGQLPSFYVNVDLSGLKMMTVTGSGNIALALWTGGWGYDAGTAASSGTLAIAENATITVGTGYDAAADLTVTGVTVDETTTSGTITLVADHTGTITLNDAVTLNSATDITISGVISGTGAVSVTQGTLTLTAANTYSGGTTVASGAKLVVNGADASTQVLPTTKTVTNNGTVELVQGHSTIVTIEGEGTTLVSGTYLFEYPGEVATVNGINTNLTVNEGATLQLKPWGKANNKVITNTVKNLTVNGTIAQNGGNVYSCGFAVSGTLSGTGTIASPFFVTFAEGATLDATAGTLTVGGAVTQTSALTVVTTADAGTTLLTGGTGSTYAPAAITISERSDVVAVVDGTNLVLAAVVCTANDKGYASIADALTALGATGGEIIVTADSLALEEIVVIAVNADATITLDLNGKGLTSTATSAVRVQSGTLALESATAATILAYADLAVLVGEDAEGAATVGAKLVIGENVNVSGLVIAEQYVDTVSVTAGTIGGTGTISGNLILASGATLDATAGTLTVGGAVTSTSTAIEAEGYGPVLTAANVDASKFTTTFADAIVAADDTQLFLIKRPSLVVEETETISAEAAAIIAEAAAAEGVYEVTMHKDSKPADGLELFTNVDVVVTPTEEGATTGTAKVDYSFGIQTISIEQLDAITQTNDDSTVTTILEKGTYVVLTVKVDNTSHDAGYGDATKLVVALDGEDLSNDAVVIDDEEDEEDDETTGVMKIAIPYEMTQVKGLKNSQTFKFTVRATNE